MTLNFCEVWKWFQSEVKANHYKKLAYDTWQTFNKYKEFKTCTVIVEHNLETFSTISVAIEYNTGGVAYQKGLCSNDESFGQFLWDNFVKNSTPNKSVTTNKTIECNNVATSNLAATTATNSADIIKSMATASTVKFIDQLKDMNDCTSYRAGDIVVDSSSSNIYQYQNDTTGNGYLNPISNGNYNWSDKTVSINTTDRVNTVTTTTTWDSNNYSNISGYGIVNIELNTEKLDEMAKDTVKTIQKKIDEMDADEHPMNRKENDNMKFANFDFGPCAGDNVRMSMYGIAVKNGSGTWVSYDKINAKIMDVDVLNFDGAQFFYKMPVAIKDITKGMVIVHNRKPMYVTDVNGTDVEVVDPCAGERKTILPTTSPFGFNFYTRVVSLLDGFGGAVAASESNPFGNMLPFLMLSDNKDIDPMMLMLMTNQNGAGTQMFNNPFMFYLMASKDDSKMKDYLPFLMMSGIK